METRVQLNSHTPNIDVYKRLPSLDLQKTYILKVENVHIPADQGPTIPNEVLFTLERRLEEDAIYEDNLAICTILNGEFTPQNVRSTPQLVWQINGFLDRAILTFLSNGNVQIDDNLSDVPPELNIDLDINKQNDWYNLLIDKQIILQGVPAATNEPEKCVRCILRTDGRIGFSFNKIGWSLFVIKLTDRAKQLFGFSHDFLAIDENSNFSAYLDDDTVHTSPPADTEESFVCVFDNSMFSNEKYRHEIVVLTTLPVSNYVDCETKAATFQSQLCSYRYPHRHLNEKFIHTSFRVISETLDTDFIFEHANRTHNEFSLTGTQLQNFHIKLVLRTYVYNENSKSYDRNEVPYPLHEDGFWTITLNIRDV